jgi:hypothetical protein
MDIEYIKIFLSFVAVTFGFEYKLISTFIAKLSLFIMYYSYILMF